MKTVTLKKIPAEVVAYLQRAIEHYQANELAKYDVFHKILLSDVSFQVWMALRRKTEFSEKTHFTIKLKPSEAVAVLLCVTTTPGVTDFDKWAASTIKMEVDRQIKRFQ